MLYSAAIAPTSWATLVFVLPHFCFGSVLLWVTWRKKVWIKGMSGTSGLVVQGIGGGLFLAVSSWAITTNVRDTLVCRTAVEDGNFVVIRGAIIVAERFDKPGAGYVRFSIDGHNLRTSTAGLSCDCGYIEPLGRLVTIPEGRNVQVRALGTRVLTMEYVE